VAAAHRLNQRCYDIDNTGRRGARMARRLLSNHNHEGSLSPSLHCRFDRADRLRWAVGNCEFQIYRTTTALRSTPLVPLSAGPARQPRSSQPWVGCPRVCCGAPSNACARTAMRTSLSRRWLRMPACRASTSAVPSSTAPGFRLMPGCASTGSSRPCRCCATLTRRSCRSQRRLVMPPKLPLPQRSRS